MGGERNVARCPLFSPSSVSSANTSVAGLGLGLRERVIEISGTRDNGEESMSETDGG